MLVSDPEKVKQLSNTMFSTALSQLSNIKFVSLRSESLAVLERLLKIYVDANQLSLLEQSGLNRLREELPVMAESGPWELRDRAKGAWKLIQDAEPDSISSAPGNAGDLQRADAAMEH
ncbi:hypothetical protein EGW08_015134 [Elysia chlorotica]|uniref:Uncharacterized protein n=1 Tax=Elysia chlorotica TaxID=188477 RepID=A0A3S1B7R8_ELYCH|nr:hypothetical protein EGW08_015134 [Elysia chlorotica]